MAGSSRSLTSLVKFCVNWKSLLLSVWLALTLVSSFGASKFMSVTTSRMDPPKGSQAYEANQKFEAVFPGVATATSFVGVIAVGPPGASVLDLPGLRHFSYALRADLNSTGRLKSFTSNATLWNDMQVSAGSSLTSDDGSTTLVTWSIKDYESSKEAVAFARTAEQKFDRAVSRWLAPTNLGGPGGTGNAPEVQFSGIVSVPTLYSAIVEEASLGLARMDAVAMPFAALVLWYILGSARLLLLPLAMLLSGASLSFGAMFCVGHYAHIQESTASLMMSVLIAMSLDYSLFVLTRFQEALANLQRANPKADLGGLVEEALEPTMQTAGFTVFVSGITLAASFVVVAALPSAILSSIGIGCSISLLIVIGLHLLVAPALLASFPGFFATCVPQQPSDDASGAQAMLPNSAATQPAGSNTDTTDDLEGRGYSSFWIWLARLTTTWPSNVLVLLLVAALTAVGGYPLRRLYIVSDLMMGVPPGTRVSAAYAEMIGKFGSGAMSPYKVLIEPEGPLTPGSTMDMATWKNAQSALMELAYAPDLSGGDGGGDLASPAPGTGPDDFHFASYNAGIPIPWELATGCMQSPFVSPNCNQVVMTIKSFGNADLSATYGFIAPKFDPSTRAGKQWLADFRQTARQVGRKYHLSVTLSGSAADTADLVAKMYEIFPFVMVGTLGLALVLVGVSFRSLFVPLRSVASICLTLLWVFGLSVLIYQDGVLDGLGREGLSGKFHGIHWVLPVTSYSIIVGICLDYDIFLLAKVTECRESGMEAVQAIRHGLCSTGGTITAAGIVMAIAFGGLMLSSEILLCGLGFYMAVAVVYDTFVVRCLLSPAVMSLMGPLLWWPSELASAKAARPLAASSGSSS